MLGNSLIAAGTSLQVQTLSSPVLFSCDFHDLFDVIGGLFTRPSKSRTALSDGAIKGKSYSVFVKRLDLFFWGVCVCVFVFLRWPPGEVREWCLRSHWGMTFKKIKMLHANLFLLSVCVYSPAFSFSFLEWHTLYLHFLLLSLFCVLPQPEKCKFTWL